MPLVDINELEEYWRDLRVGKIAVTPSADGPETVIDRAVAKFQMALPDLLREAQFANNATGLGPLTNLLTESLRFFALSLYEEQRKQDVSLLIQLFLEGSANIGAEDLKGFLRALPRSVLDRVLNHTEGSRSGLHALLSLEVLFQDGMLEKDFEVRRDHEEKLVVTFYPKEVPEPVSFRLRELFQSTA